MGLQLSTMIEPMLARLSRQLPAKSGLIYEPKWDGFRCIVFRDGATIDLRSRNQRPLARYFPELEEAFAAVAEDRFVVDGEIVVASQGRLDFSALLARLHPAASRVARLRLETPAWFVAFDVLAAAERDLRSAPFRDRRARLEDLLEEPPPGISVTPATLDREVAAGWLEHAGGGIDGVVAKSPTLRYESGRRAMLKVKRQRSADCVVGGFRVFHGEPVIASLLLGLHDGRGELRHVGVASSFKEARRHELMEFLCSSIVPLDSHPWRHGFGADVHPMNRLAGAAGRWTPDMDLDWLPVAPNIVCEVAYDHWDRDRFRYPARFRCWRPDRDAQSCTFEQFGEDEPVLLGEAPLVP